MPTDATRRRRARLRRGRQPNWAATKPKPQAAEQLEQRHYLQRNFTMRHLSHNRLIHRALQNDPFRAAKQPVSGCRTACLAARNRPFGKSRCPMRDSTPANVKKQSSSNGQKQPLNPCDAHCEPTGLQAATVRITATLKDMTQAILTP